MDFIKLHSVAKDITNIRFGRLLPLGPVEVVKYASGAHQVKWLCRCDCGTDKVVRSCKLLSGNTKSCGCLQREVRYGRTHAVKHGMYKSPEYAAWRSMLKRCHLPTSHNYSNYGERGITVCQRWRDSFEAFLADIGRRPTERHSLDRYPDNDGSYEPSNCRWATASEQARNRRTNVVVTAFGKTGPLVSFFPGGPNARDYNRCLVRIRAGWDIEMAISAGARQRHG